MNIRLVGEANDYVGKVKLAFISIKYQCLASQVSKSAKCFLVLFFFKGNGWWGDSSNSCG